MKRLGGRVVVCIAALLALSIGASVARAAPQTDLVSPTGWLYYVNVPLQTVVDAVNSGFRVVDIEIEDDDPLRVSAVLVRNTGDYAKGWWWYIGLTAADVTTQLNTNNARLIDIEPYQTASGLRFAVVMISNTGADAAGWTWLWGQTFSSLNTYVTNNPGLRMIDIQPYVDGGNLRYAAVFISNTGSNASGWWWLANTSLATVSNTLSSNNARLIDLEQQSNGNYSAVMKPNDGNAWWWLVGTNTTFINNFVAQFGARVIDIEYRNGLSYAVLRRNDNDLAINTTIAMQNLTDGSSGFLLREMGGSTLAGINEGKIFEPASTMKTFHHVHAMRQVALGNDNLANNVTVFTGLNGSCPTFTNPQLFSLQATLKQMMEQSSNTHTAAIQDRYGINAILATAAGQGATNTSINHRLGCLCGNTRNQTTLNDLYQVHRGVDAGLVDPFRDEFYDFMVNSLGSNGMGGFDFQQVLDQEIASSILFPSDETAFRNGVYAAAKGGSYTCLGAPEYHRTYAGYVRLPILSSRCGNSIREYFIGAWVNDSTTQAGAEGACGLGYTELFRDRVRAAIDTWEQTQCHCRWDLTTTNTNPGDAGYGSPDGQLNGADLSYYVERWLLGAADADVTTTNTNPGDVGYGIPDGTINGADLSFYVEGWLAGCP